MSRHAPSHGHSRGCSADAPSLRGDCSATWLTDTRSSTPSCQFEQILTQAGGKATWIAFLEMIIGAKFKLGSTTPPSAQLVQPPPFCSLDPYLLLQREPSHSTLTSEHKQLMDPSCTCKVNQLTSTATGLTTDPEMILGPCNSQDDPKLIPELSPKEWHIPELADSKALTVFRPGLITDPWLILGPCTPQDDPMLIPKFSWLDNSALIIDGEYLNALREGMIVFYLMFPLRQFRDILWSYYRQLSNTCRKSSRLLWRLTKSHDIRQIALIASMISFARRYIRLERAPTSQSPPISRNLI